MTTLMITRRWWRTTRGTLLGWAVGLAAVSTMYLSVYGTIDPSVMDSYLDSFPTDLIETFGLHDLASPAGYAQSTVYGLIGPVLVLIAGMSRGVSAIAGDESSGVLETEVSAAVSRTQVYVGRALGVVGHVLALGAVLAVVTLAVSALSTLDLGFDQVLGGAAGLTLLALLHALTAFSVGALTGRAGVALAVTVAVAVGGYFAANLGPRLADWVQPLSPWHWAYGQDPLATGPDWSGLGLLAATCVVVLALGLTRFPRRDLGV